MDTKKEFQKEIASHLLIFKNEITALTIESKKIISNALQKLNEVSKWTLLSTKSFRNVINQRQLACNFNEDIFKKKATLCAIMNVTFDIKRTYKEIQCSCYEIVNFEKQVADLDQVNKLDHFIQCAYIYSCERHQYMIREVLHGRIIFEIRRVFENNESMYIFFWVVKDK